MMFTRTFIFSFLLGLLVPHVQASLPGDDSAKICSIQLSGRPLEIADVKSWGRELLNKLEGSSMAIQSAQGLYQFQVKLVGRLGETGLKWQRFIQSSEEAFAIADFFFQALPPSNNQRRQWEQMRFRVAKNWPEGQMLELGTFDVYIDEDFDTQQLYLAIKQHNGRSTEASLDLLKELSGHSRVWILPPGTHSSNVPAQNNLWSWSR